MTFAPIGKSSISRFVSLPLQPSMNPFVNRSKSSILHSTLDRSFSSSAPVLAPKRMASPKSFTASPGITVSRSITQIALPVLLSIIILLSFVSLCVTRSGISPFAWRFEKQHATSSWSNTNWISFLTPAARLLISVSTALLKTSNLAFVSWNPSIVSNNVSAG